MDKRLPIKLHPDNGVKLRFADLFMEKRPELFAELVSRMREERDLADIIKEFVTFMKESEFDKDYDDMAVFGELVNRARSPK